MRKPKYQKRVTRDKLNESINLYYDLDHDFSLFQYRSCSSYNLSSLVTNSLWGSTPNTFNDPYDSIFRFDKAAIVNYALNLFSEIEIRDLYHLHEKDNIKTVIMKHVEKNYKESSENMKKSVLITCLSEVGNSEIMWSHYADNGRGYSVEFYYKDLKDMVDKEIDMQKRDLLDLYKVLELSINESLDWKKYYGLLPVIYDNQKFDASIVYMKGLEVDKEVNKILRDGKMNDDCTKILHEIYYDPELQRKLSTNVYGIKKKLWSYEKEWRIILPNVNYYQFSFDNAHAKIGAIVPKAIYLGEFISEGYEFLIKEHAKKHGISLYKMQSTNYKKTRLLKAKKVSLK